MAKGYRVKAGDNLWDIAKAEFGDGRAMKRIMALNGMGSNSTIRPGMVLKMPTIIRGRNDRFRITNQDIEKARQQGGSLGAMSTTYELPAYQGGGGGGGQQEDGGPQPAPKPQPGQGPASANLSNVPGSALQYIPESVKQNASGGFGATERAKQQPTKKPNLTGVGGSAQQYIPESVKQNAIGAITSEDTTFNQAGLKAFGSQQGAPFQTPATIGFTAEAPANQQGPVWDAIRASKDAVASIANAMGMNSEVLRETRDEVAQSFIDPIQNLLGPSDVEPVGSFTGGGINVFDYPKMVARELAEKDPEFRESIENGSFNENDLKRWANFNDPTVIGTYGFYFNKVSLDGTPMERIPAGAVQPDKGFPYTPEQMREMGYTLDETGTIYQLNDPGAGFEDVTGGGGTASAGGGGGSFGGGGGGGYGSGGGGGGGNRVGTRNQNGINNSVEAILKGVGSWKGNSFG